jgi:hypothetical protein
MVKVSGKFFSLPTKQSRGIASTATLARLATHRTDPRHHGLSACALPPTCALPSSTFRSPRISHPTPPRTRTLSRLGRSARLGLGSGSTRFVCEEHGDGDRAPLARLPDLNPNSTTAAQGGLAAQWSGRRRWGTCRRWAGRRRTLCPTSPPLSSTRSPSGSASVTTPLTSRWAPPAPLPPFFAPKPSPLKADRSAPEFPFHFRACCARFEQLGCRD